MTPFFKYCYGDQHFDNCWNAKLFEQQNNTFVSFETDYDQYRNALADGRIEFDRDYDAEFLKDLRRTKKFIRLFYSGGSDSHRILTTALNNNIFINEIVVNTRNLYNSKQLQPCDREVQELVYPVLSVITAAQVGNIVYRNFDAENLRTLYSNPDWMFNLPGCEIGFMRMQLYESVDNDVADCQIVGLEKPSLLCYRGRWYATTLDLSIKARCFVNNICLFYLMPGNIKSYVREALNFKQRMLASSRPVNSKFDLIPHTIEYDPQKQIGKYQGSNFLNIKDQRAFIEAVQHEDFDLIRKWQNSMDHLASIFPDLRNGHSYTRTPTGKFLWFIDLDTLEIFSQQQLIPNGFEF